jgi:hypothetical protein
MFDMQARQGKRATAYFNGELFCVQTQSGRGLVRFDLQGSQLLLTADVADCDLGSATLEALHHSRFLSEREADEFFAPRVIETEHDIWINRIMAQHNYRGLEQCFQKMLNCGISFTMGLLTFSPTHHETLVAWSRKVACDVVIAGNSSAPEVGAALRLVFSRCD